MRSKEGQGEKIALLSMGHRDKTWVKHLEPKSLKWAIFPAIVEDYAISQWPITVKVKKSLTIKELTEALNELRTVLDQYTPSATVYDSVLALELDPAKEVS